VATNSLVLASRSRYRRALLKRLGVPFRTVAPGVDEAHGSAEMAKQIAIRLAREKAQAGAERFGSAWIIGSDQVVDLDGQPLGKPGTLENARRQLQMLSGHTVLFHTALCLWHKRHQRMHERLVTTDVVFRRLSDSEIDRYLERESVLDVAGAAKSEGLGISLLSRLGGDDPTALIGLPLIALSAMLRAEGFDVP
jgi:septum formation protein